MGAVALQNNTLSIGLREDCRGNWQCAKIGVPFQKRDSTRSAIGLRSRDQEQNGQATTHKEAR